MTDPAGATHVLDLRTDDDSSLVAATAVPWTLLRAYGDEEALRTQLPSMRGWVDWCASRTERDGTWTQDFHFSDWLDPDAPEHRPYKAKTHFGFVATAYLAFSAGLLADAEARVGDAEAVERYRRLRHRTADGAWTAGRSTPPGRRPVARWRSSSGSRRPSSTPTLAGGWPSS